jgi:polysaccharide export outer membrane protein
MGPSRRFVAAVSLFLLAAPLIGCESIGHDLPPLPPDQGIDTTYRLGPSDQVNVQVFGADDLSGIFAVTDTGTVVLPLIGAVPAVGTTTPEFERTVHERLLQGHFLNDPRVTVQVMNFRPIYVLGEVLKPGDHPYVPGLTVRAAVALAGGFTPRANTTFVVVTRRDKDYRAPWSALLRPDDVVQVSERYF